jgi:uncharacterized protein YbbK (DUF523 family)
MPYILTEKINVAISACNFGSPVRYNMKGQDKTADLDRDKTSFLWTPICPEIESGLGVPRATIKLVGGNGNDFWAGKAIIKNREGKDLTAQIKTGNISAMETIKRAGCEAFVFMEGSPSCGVYRTTLKNQRLGKPPGTFGALALNEDLFLIPAQDLESPIKWWDWRRRLHAFVWLKRKKIESKQELFDIWHRYKFLCQEIDKEGSKEIGNEIANITDLSEKVVDQWKRKVLRLVRKPSEFKRIKSFMERHIAHYNKHFEGKTEKIEMPDEYASKTKFAETCHEMEKRAMQEGYDFVGVPVVFRGER